MTAIPDTPDSTDAARRTLAGVEGPGLDLSETYWGYIVRSTEPASPVLVLLQAAALLLGAAFAAATAGMWLFPAGTGVAGVMTMKLGASVVTGAIAVLLLWFASRGDRAEYQIDTSLGEVREVVRNRAGRPSLTARYGFDALTGASAVPVGRRRGPPLGWLTVTTAEGEELALLRAPEATVEWLAARMERDIALGSRKVRTFDAVHPFELSIREAGRAA
ncbi:hypothetical protein [Wenxinia marina]|uniref:Uncharacterized protein n=1 Tax=Wenxinia marina DSM 24838 TaxID=1123501 RepID=A0A0D0NNT3_9RHOB|nr:hypothetical protein [Wenxinia marina]KIQ69950.1 hypothetical protein Wenmar_01520 [Wenxinia marina DSM 24838]GGL62398.1 hypothetical protein GCM10011392_16240 [Wenxinia marina]